MVSYYFIPRLLSDQGAYWSGSAEENAVFFGNQIHTRVASDAVLTFPGEAAVPYFDVFYRIDEIKSGRHHPDGCLWIRGGKHVLHKEKASILSVYPTVLTFFGIPPRTGMAPSLLGERAVAAGPAPAAPVVSCRVA